MNRSPRSASGEPRATSPGKDQAKRSPRDSRSRSRERRSQSPQKGDSEGTVLYIGNLPRRIDDNELREHCEKYGRVADVNIIKDPYTNECRGFAFIKYENADDATDALALDSKEIDGRKIRVEKSKRNQGHQKTPGEYLGHSKPRRSNGGGYRSRRSPSPYRRRSSRDRRSRDRSPRGYRDHGRGRRRSGSRDRYRSKSRDRSGSYSRRRR